MKILEKEVHGGLGGFPVIDKVKCLRGRKSDISKSKLKAIVDIVDEIQLYLKGVLRVVGS